MSSDLFAVILAGGQSKRIMSKTPKVFHRISGKAMIKWVVESALLLSPKRVLIVGNTSNRASLEEISEEYPNVSVVVQEVPRGTGDAVRHTSDLIPDDAIVYVGSGDAPLIRGETLREMYNLLAKGNADAVILTAELPDPSGYGRVVRRGNRFVRIVEDRDASDEERNIKEVNAGFYMFRARPLFEALEKITPENAQKEYYLTDVFLFMENVLVHRTDDWEEVLGVNTRRQLAEVEKIMQKRIKGYWMDRGVTFILPDTIYVEHAVSIGQDSVIYPNVALLGNTRIGRDCVIGPGRVLKDAELPDGTHLI